MGRFYSNPQPMGGKYVTDSSPMDDRCVVQYQSDLFNPETWEGRGRYSGMIVSVIRDGDNNGIYMLTKASDYQYQLWDPNLPNYGVSGYGWQRFGIVFMDTNTNNEQDLPGSFGGDGTPNNPYYVSSVNGGTFPSNS